MVIKDILTEQSILLIKAQKKCLNSIHLSVVSKVSKMNSIFYKGTWNLS